MAETKRPISEGAEEVLNKYFPVLDYGFIGLRDYMGTDKCIEECARVSYSGGGTRKVTQTEGLLRYLRRHWHSSPYESVQLKFHVCAPIFVFRQWLRHRTLSANEISGRYSLLPMLFYTPAHEQFQKQSKNNNQGRDGSVEIEKYKAAVEKWNELRKQNVEFYTDMAGSDIARELARIDLPLSTYSQLYFSMNLHNLFHFMKLRSDNHAQYEIQAYSNTMAGIVKKVAPLSFKAWLDYNVESENFSKQEMQILKSLIKANAYNGGIGVGGSGYLDIKDKNEYNLSKRELIEFVNKFENKNIPDFELDMSQAKEPEFFEKLMLDAVPKIDLKQPTTPTSR